jgi:hypothetical protein
MNKKFINISLGIVVVIFVIIVLFRSRSPFGKENSLFAIDAEKEVTRIEFSSGDQKLLLEKDNGEWLVNGSSEARKSGVLFIIRVLREMRIKSPVSPELFDSEVTDRGLVPVKVRIFENRRLIRSFLVYKTRSNNYGNIMMMKESSKPFIVYVPGFDGDIGSGFTLNELFWQPYSVFNLLPSEIASVDFENLSDTSSSFRIEYKDGSYSLSDRNRNLAGWDSSLVIRYLSYFTWIPLESWALDIEDKEKQAIESQTPFYRIYVKKTNGESTVLSLFEKFIEGDSTDIKDSDRLYGRTMDKDELFVMRYYDIDPLLKKRSYFFPQ